MRWRRCQPFRTVSVLLLLYQTDCVRVCLFFSSPVLDFIVSAVKPASAIPCYSAVALGCTVALLLGGCSVFSKKKKEEDRIYTDKPGFTLEVDAPEEVSDLLQEHMELKRFSTLPDVSPAELRRLMLAAPKNARELLATEGYFNPEVQVSRLPAESSKDALPVVQVKVQTGKPTTVARTVLNFSGDIEENENPEIKEQKANIRRSWALPFRRQFRQEDWQSAKNSALRQLTEKNYLAGRYRLHKAEVDASKNRVALDLVLDSGPVYYFGQARVEGTRLFDETLVRRVAQLPTGEAYSLDKVIRAQQRLTESGYFSSAYIHVDPESDPTNADVQVTVQEAKLQKVILGVGASTDSGLRTSIDHKHLSVPGVGWTARTKARLDRRDRFIESEWRSRPDANLWRWVLAASVGRSIDQSIVHDYYSARFGRVRPHDELDRSVFVEWTHATVSSPSANDSSSALTGNYVLTRRAFNDRIFPTDGWGASLESGVGLTYGSHQPRDPFVRFKLRWRSYHPLGDWGLDRAGRIALRGEAGLVLAKSRATIPFGQLFILGGDSTVRGYSYRSIGVPQPEGVFPGTHMLLGSVEWQRPVYIKNVPSKWESVLFFDTGAVGNSYRGLSLNSSVGIGARWRSPIGPFQIDVGYGFKPRKLRWHLSIGAVF